MSTRKIRYSSEQWEVMNRPETQAKIRQSLTRYLESFLDSAPEGRTYERVLEILWLLRNYFKREREDSKLDDSKTKWERLYTELVLGALEVAMDRVPTEKGMAEIVGSPSVDPKMTHEQRERILRQFAEYEEEWEREHKKRWADRHQEIK